MALVRCEKCGKPEGRKGREYTMSVRPLGYPHSAAVCGSTGCTGAGLIWLEESERDAYQKGQRVFALPTHASKICAE
jgi:hypothetical protein